MNNLISIIVPVFNVRKYLNRCVESLVHQNFSKVEILLVDDGSTDGSAELCDSWAKKDPRIRVLHKSNGGLSDARNFGLEDAQGDYVAFVDSDDWVDPDIYVDLFRALSEQSTELAVCEAFLAYDDHVGGRKCSGETYSLDKVSALNRLVEDRTFRTNAWNKLYSRRLWENIRFPVGKNYEDVYIMHKIYDLCSAVTFVDKKLYYYYQRATSIVHEKSPKSLFDFVGGTINRYNYLSTKYTELKPRLATAVVSSVISVVRSCGIYRIALNKDQLRELIDTEKLYEFNGISKAMSPRLRIEFRIFKISPKLLVELSPVMEKVYERFKQ